MLGSLLGGIIGNIADNGDQDSQKAAYQAALQAYAGVNVPTIEEQMLNLQKEQSAGELTPEALQTYNQGDTKLSNITNDPRLKASQMQALQSLSQQGNEGLNASDRAAINQIHNSVASDTRGRDDAILQDMAARGQLGSGAALAARLTNSQNATQNENQQGMNLAALATQRALEATQAAGNLGGSIRNQDYSEASNAAKAQDLINQFNTQNKQNVAQYNTGTQNQAQQYNLNNAQAIANANTGIANNQETHNKGLYQTQFGNQMQKAGGVAGQQNNMGNYYGNQAQQTRGMWSGIGQGVDEAAQNAAAAMGGAPTGAEQARPSGDFMGPMPQKTTSTDWGSIISDQRAKKDISPGDNAIEDFLNKLRPVNYQYKDPNHGQGLNTGIIAQDAEKSHVGQGMVNQTPEGKAIDVKKGMAAMMAATANLHHRLRKIEGSKT